MIPTTLSTIFLSVSHSDADLAHCRSCNRAHEEATTPSSKEEVSTSTSSRPLPSMTASMSSSRRPTDHRPRQLKQRRLPRQQPAPVSHCSVKKPRSPPYCPLWRGPCWVPRKPLSKIKTRMLVTLARDRKQARTSRHQAYVNTRQPAVVFARRSPRAPAAIAAAS